MDFAPPRAVLHLHVSGSAGTSFCHLARQQLAPANSSVAGGSFNCLLPCKSPAQWKAYAGFNPRDRAFRNCMLPESPVGAGASCASLQQRMTTMRFGVLGAAETVLDESNNPAWPRLLRFVTREMLRQARKCRNASQSCCGCNAASVFEPTATGGQALIVQRRAPSPLERYWPLSGFKPLATFCTNIKYTLLMHEPVHRVISQLFVRCPTANRTRGTCAPWAITVLRCMLLYAHVHTSTHILHLTDCILHLASCIYLVPLTSDL